MIITTTLLLRRLIYSRFPLHQISLIAFWLSFNQIQLAAPTMSWGCTKLLSLTTTARAHLLSSKPVLYHAVAPKRDEWSKLYIYLYYVKKMNIVLRVFLEYREKDTLTKNNWKQDLNGEKGGKRKSKKLQVAFSIYALFHSLFSLFDILT